MASHFCLYHDIATGARLLQTFFMKRLVTILCSLLACLSLVAQTNSDNTIKFLGIPIDGSKEQMIKELKNKGFKYNPQFENLSGRFNGKDSNIYISTNNGKVDRVYVASSVLEDEASIRISYNNLLYQFKKNDKYFTFEEPQPIPDDENISYEMLVHKKRYDTSFYLKVNFTEEELREMEEKTSNMTEDEANLYLGTKALENISGQVWFTISEHYGKYYISLYYDNLKNRANGEDL